MTQSTNNIRIRLLADFLRAESAAGILLMATATLALLVANSPLAPLYALLLDTPVEIRVGALHIGKPLLLWVNDGLMAVFFLLVGLELKRELVEGSLSRLQAALLPAIAAIGGVLMPALVYLAVIGDNPAHLRGWAIPAATDIAFALGVLSLLGSRVPTSLKVLLTSIAIFDDIGAIAIIALFYTDQLALGALLVAATCVVVLALLNRARVCVRSVYLAIGVVMWVAMLKSGVHATLSGVVLAMFIPMHSADCEQPSPLKSLESDLHATVAFMVLPVFAFCNAGIPLLGTSVAQWLHPVPLAIAAGLLLGKPLGIFTFSWLAIRLRLASKPQDIGWLALFGLAVLGGIGFTMSLFIGTLAFAGNDTATLFDERIGIIAGSLLAGIFGWAILRVALARTP